MSDGKRRLKSSTKTFAIILLVLGLWSSMSAIMAPIIAAGAQAFISIAAESGPDEKAKEQLTRAATELSNVFSPLNLALLAASFLLGLGMIFGGIGTLRRRLRGALTLRWCSGLMAVFTLCQSGYQILMLAKNRDNMLQDFENQLSRTSPNQASEGMEGLAQIFFVFQIVLAVIFALAFILLYVWAFLHFNKASTLAQFEPVAEGGEKVP